MAEMDFEPLLRFMARVPAIQQPVHHGMFDNGLWWAKFSIDIEHRLAWYVVQSFGFVLNYVSIEERLPTTFHPVSPPPYLNGGPLEYLSWVVEAQEIEFTPSDAAQWLEVRLPSPVEDETQWLEIDAPVDENDD